MEGKGVTIYFEPRFIRMTKRLDFSLRNIMRQRIELFRANRFDPLLHTHALSGELAGHLAFTVAYDFRIIFRFESKGVVVFEFAGKHDDYKLF